MDYIQLSLTWSFLWFTLCTSSSFGEDNSNVCKTSRLKFSDVSLSSTAWNCKDSTYPDLICERIRPGVMLNDIYTVHSESVCCPGWMPSVQRDDDDSEDEDEKELECNQPCKKGFFGQDCSFKCPCIHGTTHSCNTVDGSCDSCLDGWMGRDCNERCSPGFFGPDCVSRSIFICMNGGVNHPVTGHCLCRSGYDGSRCEERCGGIEDLDCGHIVCENCILNRTEICDTFIGSCRCRNGSNGRYCTEPCEIGKIGQFCEVTCCSGRGYCTGESCICADGYHGDECQHKCEDGTFGRDCKGKCPCPFGCNHVTGVCDDCPPGFTGDKCTDYCSLTQWGRSCNHTCSCEEGEMCDIFTGDCFSKGLTAVFWVIVVLVLIACGVLCVVCIVLKRCKIKQRPEQTGQTNSSVRSSAGHSNSGYLTPSEINVYSTPHSATSPFHRNASTTSDGYLAPIRYYTINEALSEKAAFNSGNTHKDDEVSNHYITIGSDLYMSASLSSEH